MTTPLAVLVVEDERIVALDLQQTLIDMGYDAFGVAASAEEAIALASARCPDVVLMDIRIKGQLDGIQAAELLREKFGVAVIYLTAHADEATLERAKKTEPQGYLVKPVNNAELKSTIEVSHYRHEMSRRRQERERWLSTAVAAVDDAVITVDLAGKVTYLNTAAEALLGTSSDAALGKVASELLAHGKYANQTSAAPSFKRTPIVAEGRTVGAVILCHDGLGARKGERQQELAERLSSLGTMAAGVAHEVNNPLAVVVANVSFVLESLDEQRAELSRCALGADAFRRLDEAIAALTDMRAAAGRIGQVVADLRTFARPADQVPGLVDVAACTDWAVRAVPAELRQRADWVVHFGATPRVEADEAKLRHALLQLLVNAAQAIPAGRTREKEVTVVTKTDAEGRAVVEIRDTGVGIPRDQLDHVFDPFFTTRTVGDGKGLGLPIAHGIVKALDGVIEVESEPGRGSTFRVLLPAAAEEPARPAAETASAGTPARGRILVVDDEQMVLRAMGRILGQHQVHCTESATEALSLIAKGESFDLIFSDIVMPVMSGIEFYEALLEQRPDLAQRIVFVSGSTSSGETEDFLKSIPNLRLEKPFDVQALLDLVQSRLAELRRTA